MAEQKKNILTRLVMSLPGVKKEVKRISEDLSPGTDTDPDAYLYRPLTGQRAVNRDLTPIDQGRMQEIAAWLYDSTPFGKRLVEIMIDFILGEGLKIEAAAVDVQDLLSNFWEDPVNDWEMKLDERVTSLLLFGEQCYKVAVNEHDGKVTLGAVDPAMIDDIIADPQNAEDLRKVKVKTSLLLAASAEPLYNIIRIDSDVQSQTYGRYTGDVFYFAINKYQGCKRGRSELLNVADWIDLHEKFLFNVSEKAYWMTMFLWDVTFNGWDVKKIKKYVQDHPNEIKPGTIRYHNEHVKWEAVSPELDAKNQADEAALIKNHILSALGIPGHFMGEGGDTTRATALEMGTPTFKRFKRRQNFVRSMLKRIFNFVIDQAIIKGKISKDVDRTFKISFPPLTERNYEQAATALYQLATALTTALEAEICSKEDAVKIFNASVELLGVPMLPMSANTITEAIARMAQEHRERAERYEKNGKEKDYTPGSAEALKKELENVTGGGK